MASSDSDPSASPLSSGDSLYAGKAPVLLLASCVVIAVVAVVVVAVIVVVACFCFVIVVVAVVIAI